LVTSYDLWPGNKAGLFSNEKTSKGVDKEKVKTLISGEANDIYSAKIIK